MVSTPGKQVTQWARPRWDVEGPLRRGAWYRVVRLTPLEAVVDINGNPVSLPRSSLQFASTPPAHWTVVPRPRNAGARLPLNWGPKYGVCPNCRERARLATNAAGMRCPRCNGFFDIGWDDSYVTAG